MKLNHNYWERLAEQLSALANQVLLLLQVEVILHSVLSPPRLPFEIGYFSPVGNLKCAI